MRTRQSNTAHELGHSSDFLRPAPPEGMAPDSYETGPRRSPGSVAVPLDYDPAPYARRRSAPHRGPLLWAEEDEGLLHDASNLISAVGLYCDLLSMPGVLREEHRHYAEELRLLGSRAVAMVEQLMERRVRAREQEPEPATSSTPCPERRALQISESTSPYGPSAPLRSMVERSSGLLRRVAGNHTVQIVYGEAAALPVRVPAESVERILVNLVRNAAAAMEGRSGGPIRIAVGIPAAAARPWPFQHVCLTMEDSGCGMDSAALERLLDSGKVPSRSRHGIGFRVVRELVRSARGELLVTSRPGVGTRIEIEWPVAPLSEETVARPQARGERPWQS